MKRLKAMAAIMAAATILSTGVVPVCAADASYDVAAVEAEIMEDAAVQSEVAALADEAETTWIDFNWKGLANGQTGNLTAKAYKADLSGDSMADSSLDKENTSTVVLTDEGYEFTIRTVSASYMGQTAKAKSATVSYYTVSQNSDGTLSEAISTVDCVVDQSANTIKFTIPKNAYGMADGEEGTIPEGYDNMIKVKMVTTLQDSWLSGIFPEAMTAPTFFYLFNVAPVITTAE